MDFHSKLASILTQKTDCAVVGVYEKGKLSAAAEVVNNASGGLVQELAKKGDVKGKVGSTLLLHHVPGCAAQRVLLVGLGNKTRVEPKDFRKALQNAANAVKQTGSKEANLYWQDVEVRDRDEKWKVQQAILAFGGRLYQINALKSKTAPPSPLKTLNYCVTDKRGLNALKSAVAAAAATVAGMNFARNLGNLPGNVCTPIYLANQAKQLAKGDKLFSVSVLNEKQMEELKMGALLSVAAGSKAPAQLIIVEYKGAAKTQKPTVLVGKGITFDSGGISLKPGPQMDEMKFDMCGAASVLGTLKALQLLKPKINVVGIIAAAENMPSGRATKPGDIVTSMAGKTIEVLNTDAEGRLVLCDALSYAARFHPKTLIDIATLTGACVIALGSHASGLYSNREQLAQHLLAAGEYTGDRAWQMPLWDEYKEQLNSNFADLANIGGREAGSVTAACFLSHFAEKHPWAHLDIAGTAWLSNAEKGATGRPVPLLVNYVLNHG